MERRVTINNTEYNLFTDDEIEDLKVIAKIEEKEKMRKSGKIKFCNENEIKDILSFE